MYHERWLNQGEPKTQRQVSWSFGWTTFGGEDYEYQWILVSHSASVGNSSEGMYWGKDDEGSGHGAYKMVSAKLQLFESDDFAAIYTDAMNSGRIPSIIINMH